MSIVALKQDLKEIPGVENLTMRYEKGGLIQVYCADGIEARVGPMATTEEIRQAFLKARS